jgi:hypothetical protein
MGPADILWGFTERGYSAWNYTRLPVERFRSLDNGREFKEPNHKPVHC